MRALAFLLVCIAAFCVFGFLTSFEPGAGHIYFRIGYPIVGLVCLIGARLLWVYDRRRK